MTQLEMRSAMKYLLNQYLIFTNIVLSKTNTFFMES